jgi:2'-5' RNA ligase
VTLAFLGATDPADVPDIVERMRRVAARNAPMELTTGGLGGFPSAARATVAWYGIHDRDGALDRLTQAIRHGLAVDEKTPFRAHATVARARGRPVDLRSWCQDAAPPHQLVVGEIRLMRSRLQDKAPRYETIVTLRLGKRDQGD